MRHKKRNTEPTYSVLTNGQKNYIFPFFLVIINCIMLCNEKLITIVVLLLCITGSDKCEIIDYCQPNPCENSGTCVSVGHDFNCICKAGYTGHECQHNIDACGPKPCKNGGICSDLINGYQCNCSDTGFSGIKSRKSCSYYHRYHKCCYHISSI